MDRADHVDEMSQEAWGRWYARRGRLDLALLLFVVWDPVGVNDAPEAYDEYDGYTADCLQSISHGDANSLAEVLAGIERSRMGLSTPATRLVGVAAVILHGAQASAQRWLRSDQPPATASRLAVVIRVVGDVRRAGDGPDRRRADYL